MHEAAYAQAAALFHYTKVQMAIPFFEQFIISSVPKDGAALLR